MRERYKKRQQNVEERTWQTEIVKKEEKIYKIIDDKILPARLSSMKKNLRQNSIRNLKTDIRLPTIMDYQGPCLVGRTKFYL